MQVNVTTIGKKKGSVQTVEVSDDAFGREYNEALIHQIVVAYQLGARAGTRRQKTRAEVRGGGAKPWNQKGTGRARAGTSRGPLWRTGGVTFAARPQDHSQKVNKRMYRGAIASILSELLRTERLVVVEDFSVDAPKTKNILAQLKELNMKDVLIVMHEVDEKLYLAARNVHSIGLCDTTSIDPVSLIGYSKVLVTVPALKQIEEMLG